MDSIKHCQATKDLELYDWFLITSHVHLIIGSSGNTLSNILRDLKRHTSEELHKAIANNKTESRREWMLWLMERAAKKTSNDAKFQLWQPENHPIELTTPKIAWQKLEYTHYNPVKAGFVRRKTDSKYSSSIDYSRYNGLLNIILLDPMMI